MGINSVPAIKVSLWGKTVGVIAGMVGRAYRFEFDPSFISSGIEISPLKMPLQSGIIAFPELPPGKSRACV